MKIGDFPAFESLNDTQVENLKSASTERWLEKEEVLIKRGEPGGDLFFLLEGELLVYVKEKGREVELLRVQAPAVVGELELLTDQDRTASVRALCKSQVFALEQEKIEQRLSDGDPAVLKVMLAISRVIAGRLAGMTEKFVELEEKVEPARSHELSDFRKKLFSEWTF
jgi:CRP-like cAMP-binding protein